MATASATVVDHTNFKEKFNQTVPCIGILCLDATVMSNVVKALQKTDKVYCKKGFTSILDVSQTLKHPNATITLLSSNDEKVVDADSAAKNASLPKGTRIVILDPVKVPPPTTTEESGVSLASILQQHADLKEALESVVKEVAKTTNTTASTTTITSLFSLAKADVHLSYTNYNSVEILSQLLPPGVIVPSGFEQVGHIVHLNLLPSHTPYKKLIAQVILECSPKNTVRTVINKTEAIQSEFRELPFELLAGEPNYTAIVKQHGITFSVPYDKVYWNSRLSHEHIRLVTEAMQPGDELLDVMAGVGPFALPAASSNYSRCKVFANDLNPASVEAMNKNIELNKSQFPKLKQQQGSAENQQQQKLIETFCMDGREFIRQIGREQQLKKGHLFFHHNINNNKAASSKDDDNTNNNDKKKENTATSTVFRRHSLRHFVMNLPATAVLFLDAFINDTEQQQNKNDDKYTNSNRCWPEPLQILTQEDVHRKLGEETREFDHTFVVHVYCFSAFSDQAKAMSDAMDQVSKVLKRPVGQENITSTSNTTTTSVLVHKVHIVRDVAPNKLMVCVSFSPSVMALPHLHDSLRKEMCCFNPKPNTAGNSSRRERE